MKSNEYLFTVSQDLTTKVSARSEFKTIYSLNGYSFVNYYEMKNFKFAFFRSYHHMKSNGYSFYKKNCLLNSDEGFVFDRAKLGTQ